MKLYVYSPSFFIRPRNTDWLATQNLRHLNHFNSNIEVYLQSSLIRSLQYNARFAGQILNDRLNLPVPSRWLPELESPFDLRDVRRSGATVVYGHSPTNVFDLPLICQNGPIIEEQMRKQGKSEAAISLEKATKLRTISRSELTVLNSESGANIMRGLVGAKAESIRVLPFFLPALTQVAHSAVLAKYDSLKKKDSRVRLLFVGREAKRKGLSSVLDAFMRLDSKHPGRLMLEVVSSFSDGAVDIPDMSNIVVTGETTHEEIMRKMRSAHIMLMPSSFEAYGLVYIEAMASGTVALANNHLTQREILADGRAGLLVNSTPQAICDSLEPLLIQPEEMRTIALEGWKRVAEHYSPHVVANKFELLALEAIHRYNMRHRR